MQSELVAAEQRYRLLVEGLPVIPYRDSLDGSEAHYVSPRLEELLGYSVEQWHDGGLEWWMRLVHRDDVMRVSAPPRRASSARRRCPPATGCATPSPAGAGSRTRRSSSTGTTASRSTARACCATSPPRSSPRAPRARPSSASGRWSRRCRWRSTWTSRTRPAPTSTSSPRSRACSATRSRCGWATPRCSRRCCIPRIATGCWPSRRAWLGRGGELPRRVPAGRAATAARCGCARSPRS